jgi:hypothetical protein
MMHAHRHCHDRSGDSSLMCGHCCEFDGSHARVRAGDLAPRLRNGTRTAIGDSTLSDTTTPGLLSAHSSAQRNAQALTSSPSLASVFSIRWLMAMYYPQDTTLELGPTGLLPGTGLV